MNQNIQNLSFNLTTNEVLSLLGDPLLEKDEGATKLLVYTSKVSTKADVLYFVDDKLVLKSMSVDALSGETIESGLGQPEQTYSLLADERGTANEQWLNYWQAKGVALVSNRKLSGGKIERALYFEPMSFEQFSQIWGGAKFVKSSEKVVTSLAATQSTVVEPVQLESTTSWGWGLPGLIGLVVLIFLIVLLVFLWLKKRKKSVSDINLPPVVPPNPPPIQP